VSQSACSACHAKGYCSVAEAEEKVVELSNDPAMDFKKGEEVMVIMDSRLGWKAVIYAYLLPLLVLVAGVVVFSVLLENEGLAALIALFCLAPYYALLFLFKNRFSKEFRFTLRHIEQNPS
jgi:sigma-E factor negative regulatory protein RseC